MKKQGLTLQAALQFVQERRRVVMPNTGFMRQLKQYEEGLLGLS
jgi:hypothetical protein